MIRHKNEAEDLSLSFTKNCKALNEQTHRKAEETLEFKLNKSRETIHFNPPIWIERPSMIGLTSLEIYNSFFNITEHNNKFKLYTDFNDEFTFMELKNELEEIFDIEDITPEHLQDDKIGPLIINLYKNLKSEKSSTDAYRIPLTNYASSSF